MVLPPLASPLRPERTAPVRIGVVRPPANEIVLECNLSKRGQGSCYVSRVRRRSDPQLSTNGHFTPATVGLDRDFEVAGICQVMPDAVPHVGGFLESLLRSYRLTFVDWMHGGRIMPTRWQ